MLKKLNNYFQKLGKAFMLPIALISAAGIFLGLSAAFSNPNIISKLPILQGAGVQNFIQYIRAITGTLFSNLPVLFAIALAIGLADDEPAIAGFSGFVGFIILNVAINFVLKTNKMLVEPDKMKQAGQAMVLGIQTLELGVFGGILTGMIVGALHNKYYNIKLPDYIGFFGGTRFVPIVTTFVFMLIGLIFPVIWPPIGNGIQAIGYGIAKLGYFGTFLFGALERLLIPFGLHHILNAMFRFTPVGGEIQVAGKTVTGALNIYFAELAAGNTNFSTEATRFLAQGKIPIMVFGLPAAALAMYHTAKEEHRNKVKGILLTGALASLVTGITEPLEFSFLFVAPVLFLIHSVLSGVSFMLNHIFKVAIGNTQGGIIDLIVFGMMQPNTKWYITLFIGILYAVAYYYIFKFIIIRFNLQTPGREEDLDIEDNDVKQVSVDERAVQIINALGGKQNIEVVNNCFTRLRVTIKDSSLINEAELKKTGAKGIIKPNENNVQVIYGPSASNIKVSVTKALKKM